MFLLFFIYVHVSRVGGSLCSVSAGIIESKMREKESFRKGISRDNQERGCLRKRKKLSVRFKYSRNVN